MKICLVATTFPRFPGDGQGAFVWELARTVQQRGVDVHVVALHTPGAATHEMMDGIPVTRPRYWWPEEAESLRKDGGGLPLTLRKYPLARVQFPFFLTRHSAAILRICADCDLIHAHWTLSGGAALLGHWLHRKPLLVTVHGSDIFQIPRHPIGAQVTRFILNHADRVTAVSNALKEATIAVGTQPSHVEVISNGIDLHRFMPPSPDPRFVSDESTERIILFAGFLIKRKGVRYLIEALALLPPDLPPFRAVIIGEGPEESELRQLAKDLKVETRVEFTGFQPHAVVSEWMRRAHLFVLPSLEEGQGVVLLEALASGTPVIASDVDGIRDVVIPEVGYRVLVADPPAIAEAIRQLLSDEIKWQEMSRQSRRRAVEVYDWEIIGARFVELYQRLLSS